MRHDFNPFGIFQPFSGKLRPGEGRSLVILLGALALAAGVFAGSYFISQRTCAATMTRSADDLSWLRDEFHLSDAEMARVRQLHEGYLPQCAKMCALIAAKETEVQTALGDGIPQGGITAEARKKLTELGELRAQCQAQMIQHFVNVSQAMPPAEGQRYLDEMKKITLGSHEEIESRMAGSEHAGHEHGTN